MPLGVASGERVGHWLVMWCRCWRLRVCKWIVGDKARLGLGLVLVVYRPHTTHLVSGGGVMWRVGDRHWGLVHRLAARRRGHRLEVRRHLRVERVGRW